MSLLLRQRLLLWLIFGTFLAINASAEEKKPLRYAAIGDSYSNGEGATPAESWPALLAKDLTAHGLPTELVANPSITGWTTQQALDRELPIFIASHPTFATLQIGVNDWVQGVDSATFQARLASLLDQMLAVLPDKKHLLVVNIPDFSVTPMGANFGHPHQLTESLAAFNQIIAQQAKARNLTVVDIFALSQEMGRDPSLVAPDGLHPSAKEYSAWEKIIFPAALNLCPSP